MSTYTRFGKTRTCPSHTTNCPNCNGRGFQVWTGREWVHPVEAGARLSRGMTTMPHRTFAAQPPQMRLTRHELRCLMAAPRDHRCSRTLDDD